MTATSVGGHFFELTHGWFGETTSTRPKSASTSSLKFASESERNENSSSPIAKTQSLSLSTDSDADCELKVSASSPRRRASYSPAYSTRLMSTGIEAGVGMRTTAPRGKGKGKRTRAKPVSPAASDSCMSHRRAATVSTTTTSTSSSTRKRRASVTRVGVGEWMDRATGLPLPYVVQLEAEKNSLLEQLVVLQQTTAQIGRMLREQDSCVCLLKTQKESLAKEANRLVDENTLLREQLATLKRDSAEAWKEAHFQKVAANSRRDKLLALSQELQRATAEKQKLVTYTQALLQELSDERAKNRKLSAQIEKYGQLHSDLRKQRKSLMGFSLELDFGGDHLEDVKQFGTGRRQSESYSLSISSESETDTGSGVRHSSRRRDSTLEEYRAIEAELEALEKETVQLLGHSTAIVTRVSTAPPSATLLSPEMVAVTTKKAKKHKRSKKKKSKSKSPVSQKSETRKKGKLKVKQTRIGRSRSAGTVEEASRPKHKARHSRSGSQVEMLKGSGAPVSLLFAAFEAEMEADSDEKEEELKEEVDDDSFDALFDSDIPKRPKSKSDTPRMAPQFTMNFEDFEQLEGDW